MPLKQVTPFVIFVALKLNAAVKLESDLVNEVSNTPTTCSVTCTFSTVLRQTTARLRNSFAPRRLPNRRLQFVLLFQ